MEIRSALSGVGLFHRRRVVGCRLTEAYGLSELLLTPFEEVTQTLHRLDDTFYAPDRFHVVLREHAASLIAKPGGRAG